MSKKDTLTGTSQKRREDISLFPREYRDLAWVPRWGIARVLRRQSVAEHSYFVTLYARILADWLSLPTLQRLELIEGALHHDQAECYTGDTPGPVKHATVDKKVLAQYEEVNDLARFGPTPQLSDPKMKALLKIADLLEETMYLNSEIQLGNRAVIHMEEASRKRLMIQIDTAEGLWGWGNQVKLDLISEITNSLNEERNETSRGVVDVNAL